MESNIKRGIFWILPLAALAGIAVFASGCGGGGGSDDPAPPPHVIVANGNDQTVSLVNLGTQTVEATIPVSGKMPWEVSVSPDRTKAYVSCRGTRNAADPGGISVIDLVTRTETAYIDNLTGTDPAQSVVVGDVLYVVYADFYETDSASYLSKVDLTADPPVETAYLEITPVSGKLSIAATPDGLALYVGDWNSFIYEVDLSQDPPVVTDIGEPATYLDQYVHDLSIDGSGILYVVTEGDDLIERYDTVNGVWLDGVAHAFTDSDMWMHGVAASGNRIVAAESWGTGGFSVMTETGGVWSAEYFATDVLYDDDANPDTPDVPGPGLLHGLALAGGYAVAPIASDSDQTATDLLAVLDLQTLEVSYITVGMGPRAVEAY